MDEIETATNFAKTMRWNGKIPVIKIIGLWKSFRK